MKKHLYILTILSVLPWNNTCSAQVADSATIVNSIIRCWRSVSHEFSSIYGLEDDEIQHYSKQKICFTKDSVSLYYGVLYTPKYSVRKVNAENYTKENFDCSKQKLDITKDSVFEITITSMTKPSGNGPAHKMTDIIAFDEECIYVVVDGVIFKLVDADRKIQGRGAN